MVSTGRPTSTSVVLISSSQSIALCCALPWLAVDMVCDLGVSPIVPSRESLYPASPSLQWVPWASVPHLPGLFRSTMRPSVLCSAKTAERPSPRCSLPLSPSDTSPCPSLFVSHRRARALICDAWTFPVHRRTAIHNRCLGKEIIQLSPVPDILPSVRASSKKGYMTFAICDHPLGNIIEFHLPFGRFPTIQISLGAMSAWLA